MFIASVCPSVCLSVCLKPKFGRLQTKFDDDSDDEGSAKGAFGCPMNRGFPWIFDFHG